MLFLSNTVFNSLNVSNLEEKGHISRKEARRKLPTNRHFPNFQISRLRNNAADTDCPTGLHPPLAAQAILIPSKPEESTDKVVTMAGGRKSMARPSKTNWTIPKEDMRTCNDRTQSSASELVDYRTLPPEAIWHK